MAYTLVQKPSPNYTAGRGGKTVDAIVIHWIVGNLASADAVFAKPNGVSAHYAIEDSKVHQYVKESDTAYHAGDYPMNQRSIGIEHSASPDRPASAQTIATSAELVAQIAKRNNIPIDRKHIIKHSEVVATKCCGTVPIDEIIKQAKAINEGGTMPKEQDVKDYFRVHKITGKHGVLGVPSPEQIKYYTARSWRTFTDDVITWIKNHPATPGYVAVTETLYRKK